jgi:hypothetical protein
MHMSDIMAPGNATHFDIAHLSEIQRRGNDPSRRDVQATACAR